MFHCLFCSLTARPLAWFNAKVWQKKSFLLMFWMFLRGRIIISMFAKRRKYFRLGGRGFSSISSSRGINRFLAGTPISAPVGRCRCVRKRNSRVLRELTWRPFFFTNTFCVYLPSKGLRTDQKTAFRQPTLQLESPTKNRYSSRI